MKEIAWIRFVFAGIGLLLLVIATLQFSSTRGFLAKATHAPGTVVELRVLADGRAAQGLAVGAWVVRSKRNSA